jgi:hypothetical protein
VPCSRCEWMESCPPTTFNRQIDGADLTVQRDVGVSRHAMLEDILEGFLQDGQRQREISGGSASGMFSKCTSIVTSCRFDNSPHNPATAAFSARSSSLAG